MCSCRRVPLAIMHTPLCRHCLSFCAPVLLSFGVCNVQEAEGQREVDARKEIVHYQPVFYAYIRTAGLALESIVLSTWVLEITYLKGLVTSVVIRDGNSKMILPRNMFVPQEPKDQSHLAVSQIQFRFQLQVHSKVNDNLHKNTLPRRRDSWRVCCTHECFSISPGVHGQWPLEFLLQNLSSSRPEYEYFMSPSQLPDCIPYALYAAENGKTIMANGF